MKFYSFILAGLLLLNVSCNKEEQLPKATEEGANTFGCKIEGKLFLPENTITYPMMPPLQGSYMESDGSFRLTVSEDKDESNNGSQRYFSLSVARLTLGTISLNDINNAVIALSETDQAEQHYTTTEAVGGTLNITRLDTVANIVSGTFSFQAALQPTNTPGKIINITDGRFDIKYE
jgi:hypothetical protein